MKMEKVEEIAIKIIREAKRQNFKDLDEFEEWAEKKIKEEVGK